MNKTILFSNHATANLNRTEDHDMDDTIVTRTSCWKEAVRKAAPTSEQSGDNGRF